MGPIEVLTVAGVAVGAWALGRASTERGEGPGERIAGAGAQASRRVAFGLATVGTRALLLSAAALSATGAIVSRGVGVAADMTVTAGDAATRLVLRRSPGPEDAAEVHLPLEEGLPSTETTDSGLEIPVS